MDLEAKIADFSFSGRLYFLRKIFFRFFIFFEKWRSENQVVRVEHAKWGPWRWADWISTDSGVVHTFFGEIQHTWCTFFASTVGRASQCFRVNKRIRLQAIHSVFKTFFWPKIIKTKSAAKKHLENVKIALENEYFPIKWFYRAEFILLAQSKTLWTAEAYNYLAGPT